MSTMPYMHAQHVRGGQQEACGGAASAGQILSAAIYHPHFEQVRAQWSRLEQVGLPNSARLESWNGLE